VTAKENRVGRFGCFELNVRLDSIYSNPYDYADIALRGVFTSPAGKRDTVDGFYTTGYRIDTATGRLSATGDGHFAVRYTPRVAGTWSYALFCDSKTLGRQTGPGGKFACNPSTSPGFIRRNASPYLSFGNGSAFIPIGENMGWAGSNPYSDYRRWISRLAANKGNLIRVWMPSWGLGLEWLKGNNGYEGIGRYQQRNAALLDWLLDLCAEKNVYVLLSLDHHGQVSSKVDPNWNQNPYNAANGGPCAHTWDFFTDTTARHWIRNRFRYIVARYGYSDHIMAWELFNEVDWTDDFAHHRADVAAWHAEMAALLHRLDVNHHLITTSYGNAAHDSLSWRLPGLDFTQTHYYTDKPLDSVLNAGNRAYRSAYGKPTLNGEFGLSGDGRKLVQLDPQGIYVHNSLWAGLLGGAMGPGLSWWWDNYIDPQDLYVHFNGVAAFAGGIAFIGDGYRPAPVQATATAAGAAAGVLRAYALRSRDSTQIAAWLLNGHYESRYIRDNGNPAPVTHGVLTIPNMRNGKYGIGWWDCETGRMTATGTVRVEDGTLRITCPDIRWDKAVRVWPLNAPPSGISKAAFHTGD
jgi:hypothetical protein